MQVYVNNQTWTIQSLLEQHLHIQLSLSRKGFLDGARLMRAAPWGHRTNFTEQIVLISEQYGWAIAGCRMVSCQSYWTNYVDFRTLWGKQGMVRTVVAGGRMVFSPHHHPRPAARRGHFRACGCGGVHSLGWGEGERSAAALARRRPLRSRHASSFIGHL